MKRTLRQWLGINELEAKQEYFEGNLEARFQIISTLNRVIQAQKEAIVKLSESSIALEKKIEMLEANIKSTHKEVRI